MDLYAENILDHYRTPRHKGTIAEATVTHGEKNPSCGDALALSLRMENEVIQEVAWEGEGCAISQAGMSMLAEGLLGLTVAQAAALDRDHILALLGVPIGPRRIKCALLALHTLKNALRTLEGKPLQLWRETLESAEEE